MFGVIKIGAGIKSEKIDRLKEWLANKGYIGSLLLGVLFALAFCPYSGALYFGMLIPLTISSPDGLYLPIIFAFGTGLPVILFTYLFAFTAGKIGVFYNKITKIEEVVRFIAGAVFILTGFYYISIFAGII
jgi:cytochrome c-type biogenesis protein